MFLPSPKRSFQLAGHNVTSNIGDDSDYIIWYDLVSEAVQMEDRQSRTKRSLSVRRDLH